MLRAGWVPTATVAPARRSGGTLSKYRRLMTCPALVYLSSSAEPNGGRRLRILVSALPPSEFAAGFSLLVRLRLSGGAAPGSGSSGFVSRRCKNILLLAVTGLLISSVVCTAIFNKTFTDNYLAKSRMVLFLEDVVIGHFPIYIQDVISVLDPFDLVLRKRVFVGINQKLFARLDNSIASYPTTGKRVINRSELLAFLEGMQHNEALKVDGWGASSIHRMQGKKEVWSWFQVWRVNAHNAHPGSLIQVKLFNCGSQRFLSLESVASRFQKRLLRYARGVNHLSILQIDQDSVTRNGNEGQDRDKKSSTLIVALGLCVVLVLMNLYAWRKIDNSDYFWPWALVVIATFIGFSYCFCLFVKSTT